MEWRKSTYSNGGENCVGVANADGVVVRDSKDRDGGALGFTAGAWETFLGTLR
jgi:Domain of unknown function (DUF397)